MKYHTTILCMYLCLSIMLIGRLFTIDSQLSYEIVQFDYFDTSMRNQMYDMIFHDVEIQQRIFLPKESIDTYLSDLKVVHDLECWICRSRTNPSQIYCFITYLQRDEVYCFKKTNGPRITHKYDKYAGNYPLIETIKFVGCIQDIAVHKDYRRRGVTQALLSHFEDTCKKNSMEKMFMYVAADNEKAIHAYNKAGFLIDLAYTPQKDFFAMFKLIK
ncbi:GNAT family N-acetyltransferase [Candidatus Chromulinivorax destructor]|uniref:N-acetyltransferase domain-containing protein n=1 Tax=Candidatus Chromulinivorax destructor TaxID=2066483 RepID=A0A345ZCH1_9BACT|nr:GNAT family N-acetyltransferase [Candidatus Chromulinivorax destructor]AXK60988.1 hypothetical protein C0J27_04620 [Candidatus Chromulinivorax destructor]